MRAFIVLAVSGLSLSCGQKSETVTVAPPPAVAPTWTQVAAIISTDCAPCHNGTKEPLLTPAATFKASAAAAELNAGSMPLPPETITPADKATLLSYLGS